MRSLDVFRVGRGFRMDGVSRRYGLRATRGSRRGMNKGVENKRYYMQYKFNVGGGTISELYKILDPLLRSCVGVSRRRWIKQTSAGTNNHLRQK